MHQFWPNQGDVNVMSTKKDDVADSFWRMCTKYGIGKYLENTSEFLTDALTPPFSRRPATRPANQLTNYPLSARDTADP